MTLILSFRYFWFAMALVGAILPLSQFLPWALEDAGHVWLFMDQALTTPAARTVAADIVWAALCFSLYGATVMVRTRAWWLVLPLILTWTVGLSCGLPLFLALRAPPQAQNAKGS